MLAGREGNLCKVQLGRFRLKVRKEKCLSKGGVVVQEVTQRESGSAHGFVFQGADSDGCRDVTEGTEMPGESQVGKQDGCQEPEGKEVQAWASAGQPAAEMSEDSGKAERPKRTKGLCALGYGSCLFHQGL